MIIHAVYAENLLKYKKLVLEDLPEKGLISISGQNEAGKSTTGEVICFALFGRTFSLSPENISKALRWGESRCQVTVTFSVGDSKRYQVTRYLDDDNNQGVKVNEEGHEDVPLARGISACEALLGNLIGFRYEEFIESFYLAQREITTPHPHSHAVKTMAGIAALEEVAQSIEVALPTEQESLDTATGRCDELSQQLAELALEEGLLARLQQQQHELSGALKEQRRAAERLQEDVKGYAFMIPELSVRKQVCRGQRSRSRWFVALSFILMSVFLGGWFLLTEQAESRPAQQVSLWLLENVDGWQASWVGWGLTAGLLLLLSGFFFLSRSGVAKRNLRALMQEQEQGVEKFQQSFQALHELQGEDDEKAAERARVTQALAEAENSLSVVQECSAALLVASDESMECNQQQGSELASSIEVEKGRCRRELELQGMRQAFEEKQAEVEMRIQVRETALALLEGSCRHIAVRFNRDVRSMAGESLPSLTDGRYQHLEVDADLNVRVFSNEKRDFMVLDEVSSGTQRQIMLALRLALSQELANTAIEGGQFLFLDEPFAFFDEQRMRSSLKVLPNISRELSQIFVISQEFPADVEFDMKIRCARSIDELTATLE
ncbi:MAG: AAA family ATPase [Gammaproteobacteria bacterium]|nr:AAA family ATPase [Gammaproteobacteria bacterium]